MQKYFLPYEFKNEKSNYKEMYGSPQMEQTAPAWIGAPQLGHFFSSTSPQTAQNLPPTGSAFSRSGIKNRRPSTS
jgi:hypothetical protein